MSAEVVLAQAEADGVALYLSGDAVKAKGEQAAVGRWVPLLREHKSGIRDALKAERDRERSLEGVLKDTAICWELDATGERLWIVADEDDAKALGKPRGEVYTAEEVRIIASIGDRQSVADLRAFKQLAKSAMKRGGAL